MANPEDYTVLITDEDLVEIGHPISNWSKLECELKFNEPGFGAFEAPASDTLLDAILTPNRRAVVIRDGAYLIGGPIERPATPFGWAANDGDSGRLTVAFSDDMSRLAGRITFPDPTLAATSTSQPSHYTVSATNAETLMRNLVNLNGGPGALAARQVPSLVLGSAAGVGDAINFRTRFEPLCDALRSAAIQGGGLGFKTVQTATDIEFLVYEPTDRTGSVRFSRGLGNLRAFTFENEAPRVTSAIVGGGGEGDARLIVQRTDSAATTLWGLTEVFVDQRQTTDTTELEQAGDEALAEGAETAKLTTVTVETPTQRFGPHFGLGDLVTVELFPGYEVAEVVRSVHVEVDADGELLTVLIGSQDANPDPAWIREIRRITRSVGRLETI